MQSLAFIDVPTLFFLTGLMFFLYAGMQPIAYLLARDTPGIGKWATGNFLSALGALLILGRSFLPPSLTVIAANVAILAGFCLMLAGVRRFNGRAAMPFLPFVFLLGFHLVILLHFTYIRNDVTARTICYNLFTGGLALLVAREATLSFRARSIVPWIYAATLILHALFNFFRAFLLIGGAAPGNFLRGGLFIRETLLETVAFLFALSIAFALMLMHRLSEENRALAEKDPLTGLLNRRVFMELAEREWARAARAGSCFSVACLDLDRFKEINDTFGHAAGDMALKSFSEILSGRLRKSDLIGRTGGDEFLLLLPDTGGTGARIAVEAVLAAVREHPVHFGGAGFRLSASAGISCSGEGSLDRIFQEADAALYDSKKAGRDRATLYGA